MKKLLILSLTTLLLTLVTFTSSQAATVAVYPDGTHTVNLATYNLGTPYHAQVDFTAGGVDYITVINSAGDAFAWGYVEYDVLGNEYLYVSDDGYSYYYLK